MRLYWLRDDQWERIKDLLPGKASDRGVTVRDNRFLLSPYCGLPEPAPLGVICPIAVVMGIASTRPYLSDSMRQRTSYPKPFKAQVVQECLQPGVSMASVALRHGINANLVRKSIPAYRDGQRPGAARFFSDET